MKNWSLKWYLSLTLLLALAGCSSSLSNMMAEKLGYLPSHPNITKISLPPKLIVKDSFSLLPLNEDGWIVDVQGNDTLLLRRRFVSGETRVISGFVRPMPADATDDGFLTFAKAIKKIDDPKRLVDFKQETQKDDSSGKDCVRVRSTMKDMRPRNTGRSDPMIIDSLFWVCKHPDGKKAVIVEYSDRFYPGNEEATFEQNAEAIFHGLELITVSSLNGLGKVDNNCPAPSKDQLNKNGYFVIQNGVTLKCQVKNYTNRMSCIGITDSTGADGLLCSNGEKQIIFLFDENQILKGSKIFN